MMATAAVTQHERGSDRLGSTLARIKTVTGDALAEMRALLYELQPTTVAEEGLVAALPKLVAAMQVRTEVPITFTCTVAAAAVRRPSAAVETAIFRIVQEAVGNAIKYAQATAIAVTLTEAGERLHAEVRDDGVGFDPTARVNPSADGRRGGMGVPGMRTRAAETGLELQVMSASGEGTLIAVATPLPSSSFA
jgi:signal transduction histidine kinase